MKKERERGKRRPRGDIGKYLSRLRARASRVEPRTCVHVRGYTRAHTKPAAATDARRGMTNGPRGEERGAIPRVGAARRLIPSRIPSLNDDERRGQRSLNTKAVVSNFEPSCPESFPAASRAIHVYISISLSPPSCRLVPPSNSLLALPLSLHLFYGEENRVPTRQVTYCSD